MTDRKEIDGATAARLLATWRALHEGKLAFGPEVRDLAEEFMAAPLTMVGLVDTSRMSNEALAFGRSSGGALAFFAQREPAPTPAQMSSAATVQAELFELFAKLFAGLTGRAVELVANTQEIKDRMLWRFEHEFDEARKAVNSATDELVAFYNVHGTALFTHAKTLGGMRLVTGGQRAFGASALNAVRITGLYADTQLVPDPVYPYLSANLNLNAKHLQLANTLFYMLQLRPLVDAEFPVPPVYVFPSFEESLEENDPYTKHGIEQLSVRILAPFCDAKVASVGELFDFAKVHGEAFARALLDNGLFIPPGGSVGQRLDVAEAAKAYLAALEGVRSAEMLDVMKRMPTAALLLNGALERIRPHYHLLENATELGAQPLLSQQAHWHYFEMCAQANAEDLRRKAIISEQAFQTLRAVQDDSLSWLARIPVDTLAELISNNEHRWLREELNKYTAQLTGGATINPNDMVREVNFGLSSLVQRQQKAMADIERKYAPKKMSAYFAGATSLAAVGVATFLPSLSPFLGVAGTAVAAVATIGAGAFGFGKEKVQEGVEKRQAERSMLGVLATVRPR